MPVGKPFCKLFGVFYFLFHTVEIDIIVTYSVLNGKKMPSSFKDESVISQPLTVGGNEYKVTLVSMGNPHCVVFHDPDKLEIEKVGRLFENEF